MTGTAAHIRPARAADLTAITAIYNEAIRTTTATMDTEPKTVEERARWMEQHDGRYAVLVAEAPGEGVVGWASLSRWSDRLAYDETSESSVYVQSAWRGRGIGSAPMQALLQGAD